MPVCHALLTWESVSAQLPSGPTNSVLDVTRCRVSGTPRSGATSPIRRRDAASPVPVSRCSCSRDDAFTRLLPAGGAVLNGAGECTGFITAGECGTARDAGLPDLDPAARPRLRRRLRADARGASRSRRGLHHPRGRRVRRLIPQRRPADAGDPRRRRGGLGGTPSASVGCDTPPAEGASARAPG